MLKRRYFVKWKKTEKIIITHHQFLMNFHKRILILMIKKWCVIYGEKKSVKAIVILLKRIKRQFSKKFYTTSGSAYFNFHLCIVLTLDLCILISTSACPYLGSAYFNFHFCIVLTLDLCILISTSACPYFESAYFNFHLCIVLTLDLRILISTSAQSLL